MPAPVLLCTTTIHPEKPHGTAAPEHDSRLSRILVDDPSSRRNEDKTSMDKPIRKAVLPVAGLGTRFLPATKAVPKEMLTVVDRPILQHVVDEAREAGVEKFIFVTGRNKGVIEDHFDIAYELDDTLRRRGKHEAIAALQADMLPEGAASFTRQ